MTERTTRRGILGLFGVAAVAPVLPKLPAVEAVAVRAAPLAARAADGIQTQFIAPRQFANAGLRLLQQRLQQAGYVGSE